jgi:hypothetical protein
MNVESGKYVRVRNASRGPCRLSVCTRAVTLTAADTIGGLLAVPIAGDFLHLIQLVRQREAAGRGDTSR